MPTSSSDPGAALRGLKASTVRASSDTFERRVLRTVMANTWPYRYQRLADDIDSFAALNARHLFRFPMDAAVMPQANRKSHSIMQTCTQATEVTSRVCRKLTKSMELSELNQVFLDNQPCSGAVLFVPRGNEVVATSRWLALVRLPSLSMAGDFLAPAEPHDQEAAPSTKMRGVASIAAFDDFVVMTVPFWIFTRSAFVKEAGAKVMET